MNLEKLMEVLDNGLILIWINYGYHSYVNPLSGLSGFYDLHVKCVIPKGSIYYTDGKYYVSSQIRLDLIQQKDGTWSMNNPYYSPKEIEE